MEIEDIHDPAESPPAPEPEPEKKTLHGAGFHVRRVFVYICIALLYALVFFQRTCPSIVAASMAEDYGVEKSALGIFSSIFFYPYGLIQPFAGLLSDIVEPAFVIGGSQLLAAVGACICGASNGMGVGCFGRFLVGLGCGPTYVPVCRCILNWFPLRFYPHMVGLLLAIGGVGGIIAQGPLATIAEALGWRAAFYIVGGIGGFLSILCLIFVRGNPTAHGYPPVNKDLATVDVELTCKDRMKLLWQNFKKVVRYKWFWVVVIYCIFSSGPYFDISGLWASPYLQDVFGMDTQKSGDAVISLSIGLIVGSLAIPPISSAVHTRKWVLCATCSVAFAVSLSFLLVSHEKINYVALYFMFIFIGMTTNSMTSVAYPLVREYYHPAVAGTAVGCANIFTFLSSAVYQTISSEIIKRFGFQEGSTTKYTVEGYKWGLWLVCTISFGIAAVVIAITRDTRFTKDGKEEGESEEEEPEHEDKEKAHKEEEDEKEKYGSDLGEL